MNPDLVRIIDFYLGIPLIQIKRLFNKISNKKKKSLKKLNIKSLDEIKDLEGKKILITKFIGLGNIIFSTPFIKELSKKHSVSYLTYSSNSLLLEGYSSYLDNIEKVKKNEIPIKTLNIIKRLKDKYDIIIDLEIYSRYSALLTSSLGFSIGFNIDRNYKHYLYDYPVKYKGYLHIVEEYFNILKIFYDGKKFRKLKENIKLIPPEFDKESKKKSQDFIKENNLENYKLVGFHLGSSENAKQRRYPYFEKVIQHLVNNSKFNRNFKIILFSPERGEEYHKSKEISKKYNLIVSSNDLKTNIEIMKNLDLFVGVDSGPLHIASSLGIKVLGLYGPNTPVIYGPYTKNSFIFYKDLLCSPCITNFNNKKTNCKNPGCMEFSPLIIANKIIKLLEI